MRPTIVDEIHECLFPLCPEAKPETNWAEFEEACFHRLRSLPDGRRDYETEPDVVAVCEFLSGWQNRWGLQPQWCSEIIFTTLNGWKLFEHDRKERKWIYPAGARTEIMPLAAPPGLPIWNADSESKSQYLEGIDQRIEKALEDAALSEPLLYSADNLTRSEFKESILSIAASYCSRLEQQLSKNGIELPIFKDWPELPKHVEWAVRWHVLGESITAISKPVDPLDPAMDRANVSRQARKVLAIVGLTPRRKFGRPKGSKDSLDSERQRKQIEGR